MYLFSMMHCYKHFFSTEALGFVSLPHEVTNPLEKPDLVSKFGENRCKHLVNSLLNLTHSSIERKEIPKQIR